jgi:hypothetical protein
MNTKTTKKPAAKKSTVRTARNKAETRSKPVKEKTPFNYRTIKIYGRNFRTASKAAVYMLRKTKLSQSEIARRCGVSQPCVCQLAAILK